MFARSRIALATQFLFICFSLVSGDHEADWFRTTEDGRRGGEGRDGGGGGDGSRDGEDGGQGGG